MKKVKILLFMLCGLLLFVTTAKAADKPYTFDFETAKERNAGYTNNIPFKDGYVIYNVDKNWYGTEITYYDKTGKEIESITIEDGWMIAMEATDDYLYGVYVYDDETTHVIKYDSKLNEVKDLKILDDYTNYSFYEYYYGYDYMTINNEIAIWGIVDDKITIVDQDLKNVSHVNANNKNLEKYFPEIKVSYDFWDEYDPDSYGWTFEAYKDGKVVYTTNRDTCPQPSDPDNQNNNNSNNHEPCLVASIHMTDKNFNLIWEKEFEEYTYFNTVQFIDGYIIVAGVKNNGQRGDLLVFDLKGNLIQTISGEASYYYYEGIVDTPSGFIVTQTTCPMTYGVFNGLDIPLSSGASPISDMNKGIKSNRDSKGGLGISMDCQTNHQVYYLYHKIETKVSGGKGKIEVIGQQKPGEPVTFKITPEKGYVLSKVLVTDSTGKTVVFTNNVFTMPNADVTIEAVFVKEAKAVINPDTGIGITILVTGAVLVSFAVLLYSNKKLKWLK